MGDKMNGNLRAHFPHLQCFLFQQGYLAFLNMHKKMEGRWWQGPCDKMVGKADQELF
jgi:hypothetical protein